MTYDKNSFLQGIAVGKSMKGWSSGQGTAVPSCWNDEGIYTYFYIDYHLSLAGITKGLFNLSTSVISEHGTVEVTDIEQVNATTLKVYCDLNGLFPGWVAVIGYNSAWMTYSSGVTVPEFGAAFWLNGEIPWNFGYIEDATTLAAFAFINAETLAITHNADTEYNGTDTITISAPGYTNSETLTVTYS